MIRFTALWLVWLVVVAVGPNLIPPGSTGDALRVLIGAFQPILLGVTVVFSAAVVIGWAFVLVRGRA